MFSSFLHKNHIYIFLAPYGIYNYHRFNMLCQILGFCQHHLEKLNIVICYFLSKVCYL